MLPLGVVYFTLGVNVPSRLPALLLTPLVHTFKHHWGWNAPVNRLTVYLEFSAHMPASGEAVALCLLSSVQLFVRLRSARGFGTLCGQLAKQVLVPRALN